MKKPMPKAKKGTFLRVIRTLYTLFPVRMTLVTLCIIFSAAVSSIPSLFMERVISVIEAHAGDNSWALAVKEIVPLLLLLGSLYLAALLANFLYNRAMAVITQQLLYKLRGQMFAKMQKLPIRYFDTHKNGDVMSYYTNDIDTLREMVSRSFPQIINSGVILLTVFIIMFYFCAYLAFLVIGGVILMSFISRRVGGGSAKYFVRQQRAIGKTEGFVQEMMNGQKVVKVFCHEDAAMRDFDAINDELFSDAERAHKYANTLMPILNNLGNILYALVAIVGGILIVTNAPNLSLSGLVIGPAIIVPFLNITKQFSGNVSQLSQQINAIVMGLAGADRIFTLIDEEPEVDDGYVTLVNARENEDGTLTECAERTGLWAWRHPHGADGSVTYTPLRGDVRFFGVDFGYRPDKTVLHDISIYAEPGQKIAFVGATGAGKTTITNLINRFYDIADGKVRYDGININKIKKADLRRSLGIVLQDTCLFTGTVMENIRYGRLEATDEECIRAATLAGAHDFITRLPDGYATVLTGGGAGLSQGQRQLLAIARAAVADPPVMILDEATSSIDTHTEAIVQRGMDNLMKGRTVFVIAHRLSTVRNSDVIMVLEQGRIIERGSHDSLIAERGKYYQLYTGAFELE
ncbi:MAG: ABC transporter ATP-binding protein [Clostridia bacterium]|nr:ABC transporter ATP-binding protein [Clostridia bacterium]